MTDALARRPLTSVPVCEDQSVDNRTLPLNAPPIPSTLADRQVIAFAFVPARTGEKPSLAVAVVREDERPIERAYAAYHVAAGRDGDWEAYAGFYDCSYRDAMAEFAERLSTRV